jgi:hypothetical protein
LKLQHLPESARRVRLRDYDTIDTNGVWLDLLINGVQRRQRTVPATEQTIEELLGDPDENYREIQAFSEDVRAMAQMWAKLVARYPGKFIAFYQGRVQASSSDMKRLFTRMDSLGVPRAHAVVRFIEAEPGNLIL